MKRRIIISVIFGVILPVALALYFRGGGRFIFYSSIFLLFAAPLALIVGIVWLLIAYVRSDRANTNRGADITTAGIILLLNLLGVTKLNTAVSRMDVNTCRIYSEEMQPLVVNYKIINGVYPKDLSLITNQRMPFKDDIFWYYGSDNCYCFSVGYRDTIKPYHDYLDSNNPSWHSDISKTPMFVERMIRKQVLPPNKE